MRAPLRTRLLAVLAASALVAGQAAAQSVPAGNFGYAFLDANQQLQSGAFKTLDAFIQGLRDLAAFPLQMNASIRGIAAQLSVSAAGGPGVTIVIPALGITQTFPGPTRNQSITQLQQFLTQRPFATLLQREAARVSPFDPVAGNPSSLMARAVAADFGNALSPFASNVVDGAALLAQAGGATPAGAVAGPFRSLPGAGLRYDRFSDAGQVTQGFTLPLSYTLRSDLDPRRQLSISLPLTVADVDGARAYLGTFSSALRLPLARDWALTGAVGYAQVRASALGTAGQLASAALTSAYVYRSGAGDFVLGDLVGYYRTLGGSVAGIPTDSHVASTVLRNGLLWSHRADWLASGFSVEASVVNTQYLGAELYLRNYTEIGVSLGSNKRADSVRSYFQGGVTYLLSSKTKGVIANVGYWL